MEIWTKNVKTFAKYLEIWAKMAPNFCRITWRAAFLEVIPKKGLFKKIFAQNVVQRFSGKFGEIRAKILRTHKKLPAPTPTPVRLNMVNSVGRPFSFPTSSDIKNQRTNCDVDELFEQIQITMQCIKQRCKTDTHIFLVLNIVYLDPFIIFIVQTVISCVSNCFSCVQLHKVCSKKIKSNCTLNCLNQGSPTWCPRAPCRPQGPRWSPKGLFWK